MKVQVIHFSASSPKLNFDELISAEKSTKIAENTKLKVEYWFDPKTSTIYGYDHGKTTVPVSEFAVKDQDYLDGIIQLFKDNKSIKFM
jgi:hypothetical protein